jgi:hypothetical protein
MYWDWTKGRPQLRPINESDSKQALTTQADETTKTNITRIDPEVSSRILGVFLSPLGDFSKQIHVLKTKADTFAI